MPVPARPALRTLALCAALTATAAAPAVAGEAPIRLAPGETTSFAFAENPSTGFTWALDETASRNLAAVAVADGGYRPGKPMPGAPGERLWSVRGVTPGRAEIVFVYRRPWEPPAPAETRRVVVVVGPAQ